MPRDMSSGKHGQLLTAKAVSRGVTGSNPCCDIHVEKSGVLGGVAQ
jgi:hypothetical protein